MNVTTAPFAISIHNSRDSTTSEWPDSESPSFATGAVGSALTFVQIHVDAYMFTLDIARTT